MRTDTYRESQTGTSTFPLQWLHLLLHPGTDRLRHLAASAAWRLCGKWRAWLMALSLRKISSPTADNRHARWERRALRHTPHTQASQLPHTQAFWQILSLRVWLMSARTNYDNDSSQRVRDRVAGGMLIHKSAFTPSAPSLRHYIKPVVTHNHSCWAESWGRLKSCPFIGSFPFISIWRRPW